MIKTKTPLQRRDEWGAAWFFTGQMAIAFARCILRLSEKDPRRAHDAAVMLELWLAAALSKLTCDMAAQDICRANDFESRQLYAVAQCFVSLILFVQRLKCKYAAMAAKLPMAGFARIEAISILNAPAYPVPVIDSS